jgi:hypothetical protein
VAHDHGMLIEYIYVILFGEVNYMAEKRNIVRLKKRLSLKFGSDAPTKVAFTEDLSQNGLFVKTVAPAPPGTRLMIELTLPEGDIVLIEGMSRWRKSAPPQVIHLVNKKGMGIKILRFISGEEHYRRVMNEYDGKYSSVRRVA